VIGFRENCLNFNDGSLAMPQAGFRIEMSHS
jgi:hypothetical protein